MAIINNSQAFRRWQKGCFGVFFELFCLKQESYKIRELKCSIPNILSLVKHLASLVMNTKTGKVFHILACTVFHKINPNKLHLYEKVLLKIHIFCCT